jgi:hypothetical protein
VARYFSYLIVFAAFGLAGYGTAKQYQMDAELAFSEAREKYKFIGWCNTVLAMLFLSFLGLQVLLGRC